MLRKKNLKCLEFLYASQLFWDENFKSLIFNLPPKILLWALTVLRDYLVPYDAKGEVKLRKKWFISYSGFSLFDVAFFHLLFFVLSLTCQQVFFAFWSRNHLNKCLATTLSRRLIKTKGLFKGLEMKLTVWTSRLSISILVWDRKSQFLPSNRYRT